LEKRVGKENVFKFSTLNSGNLSAVDELEVPNEVKTYFEELKVKLAFRLSLMFLIVFIILCYAYSFDSIESTIVMALGVFISLVCLLIVSAKRNYNLVFHIYSISGVVVTSYALITFHNTIHLVDVLWMLAGVSLAFFALGRVLGFILLTISLIAISIFVFYSLNIHIEEVQIRTTYQKFSLVIEMISGFSVNFYLHYLFFNVNKFSERKLIESVEQLKEQNIRISHQNDEKTMLVREIHHRVKNNLQIVVSLLRMQSQEVNNPEFRLLFQESINRIMAMSLIHQKLYQNTNLSQVRIEDYLNELVHEIIHLNITGEDIGFKIQTEVNRVGLKTLVPLGLLVNELVSNSLKHAFTDNQDARIEITISRREDGWLDLMYFDSGIWKENSGKSSSFGLILIDTLVEQLEGTKSVQKENSGTTYSFYIRNMEETDIIA
jgi:two-component system, sensor histidine kinase PdtaS